MTSYSSDREIITIKNKIAKEVVNNVASDNRGREVRVREF